MTISPEAKVAAIHEHYTLSHATSETRTGHYVQHAINSVTTPLHKEIDKWKAAHDNQVKLRRMLMDRPDLKERAALVSGLIEENQKLQKEIERLKLEAEELQRNTIGTCSICHHRAWKPRADGVEECEVCRLRGEVEKAYREGTGGAWICSEHTTLGELYERSRAKRVAEGKE